MQRLRLMFSGRSWLSSFRRRLFRHLLAGGIAPGSNGLPCRVLSHAALVKPCKEQLPGAGLMVVP